MRIPREGVLAIGLDARANVVEVGFDDPLETLTALHGEDRVRIFVDRQDKLCEQTDGSYRNPRP